MIAKVLMRKYKATLNVFRSSVRKEFAGVRPEHLSTFFEKSWRTGEVAQDWRQVNVVPVSKKGRREELTGNVLILVKNVR